MTIDTHDLARRGAEIRYQEVLTEIAELQRFLKLKPSPNGAGPATATPRRRTMSRAQRKAVSLRMKRYWAAQRALRRR